MPIPARPSAPSSRLRASWVPVALLAALLAACGGGSDDDTPPAPKPAPDPLVKYQWYLHNEGQDVLAGARPLAGIDLNMGNLHERGITGKGVQVAVVDDGLDIRHEDLAANVLPKASVNFNDCPGITGESPISALNGCGTDPSPIEGESGWSTAHGTAVAGIIGMVGGNGVGGMGVAHEASLQGFNYLSGAQAFGMQLFALGEGNTRAERTAVFNMSYGSSAPAGVRTLPGEESSEFVYAMERVLASTRNALGGLYLKSAGNSFEERNNPLCQASIQHGVGCLDALVDATNSLFGVMVVGAVDAIGEPSSYSSAGANVWISGFGGEYNHNRDFNPNATEVQIQPAILSTDWGTNCNVGYHSDLHKLGIPGVGVPPRNAIDNGSASTIDPQCRYTAGFNGTSAAAPTVSGVTALVVQARPDLTARDIRHILVTTARNDTWRSGALPHWARYTEGGREFDAGWHTNTAGLRFSRWYGYGLVDATAAVNMATTFKTLPPVVIDDADSEGNPVPISYGNVTASPNPLTLEFPQDLTIEAVQLSFATTHLELGKLLVTLTSPAGTRIPVIVPYSVFAPLADNEEGGAGGVLLGVNGFMGEPAQGQWSLTVEDVSGDAGNTDELLTAFNVRVQGHARTAP